MRERWDQNITTIETIFDHKISHKNANTGKEYRNREKCKEIKEKLAPQN